MLHSSNLSNNAKLEHEIFHSSNPKQFEQWSAISSSLVCRSVSGHAARGGFKCSVAVTSTTFNVAVLRGDRQTPFVGGSLGTRNEKRFGFAGCVGGCLVEWASFFPLTAARCLVLCLRFLLLSINFPSFFRSGSPGNER